MKASIICETCKNLELGKFESINPSVIGAVIVACHATPPHAGSHRIVIRTEEENVPNSNHDLWIKCVGPNCGSPKKEVKYKTYLELVSALTISFHTEHEGHALEIYLDGVRIHPSV